MIKGLFQIFFKCFSGKNYSQFSKTILAYIFAASALIMVDFFAPIFVVFVRIMQTTSSVFVSAIFGFYTVSDVRTDMAYNNNFSSRFFHDVMIPKKANYKEKNK